MPAKDAKFSKKSSPASSPKKGGDKTKNIIQKSSSTSLRRGDVMVKKQLKKTAPKKENSSKKKKKSFPITKDKSPPKTKLTNLEAKVEANSGEDSRKEDDEEAKRKKEEEDPMAIIMQRERAAAKREQDKIEVAASIEAAALAVAPSRVRRQLQFLHAFKDMIKALKLARKYYSAAVVPSVHIGVLYDFTVIESSGSEVRVVLEGPQVIRRKFRSSSQALPLPYGDKRVRGVLLSKQHWREVIALCGAGITVHLLHLLVAAAASLLLLLLFTPAIVQHSLHYAGHLNDFRLLGTTACLPVEYLPFDSDPVCQSLLFSSIELGAEVNNTAAASGCIVQQRPDCPLPHSSLVADLLITALLSLTLLIILLVTAEGDEGSSNQHSRSQLWRLKNFLDMQMPTARDFTVQVTNPTAGATDPLEWFHFFNRHFGKVQNVTITFDNNKLVKLLLKKRRLLRYYTDEDIKSKQLLHKSSLTLDEERLLWHCQSWRIRWSPSLLATKLLRALCLLPAGYGGIAAEEEERGRNIAHMKNLCDTNKDIFYLINNTALPQPQSVFVTFEQQRHMWKCLETSKLFRGKHTLSLRRPAEPEAIRWCHVRLTSSPSSSTCCNIFSLLLLWGGRFLRRSRAWLLSFLTVVVACVALLWTRDYCGKYWGGAFVVVDFLFSVIFRLIVSGLDSHYETEDDRQHSLFIKLSIARVVSFSLLLYFVVPWEDTLEDTTFATRLTTQLLIGVVVPTILSMDLRGVYRRWITAPLLAFSQDQDLDIRQAAINHCWELSSNFIVAEHSSRMVSTCCLCLLHLVTSPLACLVLLLSLVVSFTAESHLLASRHHAVHIFRSKMANSFVIALLIVLFLHAYMSCRLVYSWPFDEAFINDDGLVMRVDKRAPLLLWKVADGDTSWHSDSQATFYSAYRALSWLLASSLALILVAKMLHLFELLGWFRSWWRTGQVEKKEEVEKEEEKEFLSCQHGDGHKCMYGHALRYSGVQNITSYCPLLWRGAGGDIGGETLLFCDVAELLPRYLPEVHCQYKHESTNLIDYLPSEGRTGTLLARAKSFPYNVFSKFPILFDEGVYNSRLTEEEEEKMEKDFSSSHTFTAEEDEKEGEGDKNEGKEQGGYQGVDSVKLLSEGESAPSCQETARNGLGDPRQQQVEEQNQGEAHDMQLLTAGITTPKPPLQLPALNHAPMHIEMEVSTRSTGRSRLNESPFNHYDIIRRMQQSTQQHGDKAFGHVNSNCWNRSDGNVFASSQLATIDYSRGRSTSTSCGSDSRTKQRVRYSSSKVLPEIEAKLEESHSRFHGQGDAPTSSLVAMSLHSRDQDSIGLLRL